MTEKESSAGDGTAQIDFSKYRTPELFKTISDLLSVSEKAGQVAWWSMVVCVSVVAAFIILTFQTTPLLVVILCAGYLVPAGWSAGLILGLAEIVRRSANGLLLIVDLLLAETANIANDVRGLRGGTQQLPPPGVLVDKVYHQVIYPIIEEVVTSNLGFVGRPLLWFYRVSLDRMVKIVIRRFVPDSYDQIPDDNPDLEVTKKLVETASAIEANEDGITSGLNWTRGKVKSIGSWLKLLIVMPCYAMFAMAFIILVLPAVVAWYLTSAPPAAEVSAWWPIFEPVFT